MSSYQLVRVFGYAEQVKVKDQLARTAPLDMRYLAVCMMRMT